ncbi:BatD family protein [bacterium]|nr:BatD family protein [bacterium]
MGLVSLVLSPSAFAFFIITATLDKNPVVVNESFVLTITADDDVNTNALDTSALMKDFIVGRTSVSSQTSMMNFKTSRTTKWTTVLIARKPGKYLIPAFTIKDEQSQAIAVNVLASSDPKAEKQQDLFITSKVSAKELYVQQQVTLTVKLHFAAELKRGSLTEPTLENANITQIGKDIENETIINGRRYRVIERTYAISPQQSGEFILKSPVFSGEVMVKSNRRSNFLSFAETKPVSVIGDEIALHVLPVPESYQGAWLPSELLAIHQEWQPSVDTFTVGEPITRVVTLTAAGLSEEQLPEIIMTVPKGLKVYPDQAELHTGMNNDRLVSQKVRNFALVANTAGTYQLPEIVIPWWNTVTNKIQQARLPAQTITVVPNPDQPEPSAITLDSEKVGLTSSEVVYVQKTPWLQWLFLALWLLTSFAWILSAYLTRDPSNKKAKKIKKSDKVNDAYLGLLAACKQNNGEQALDLIVPWFNKTASKKCSTLAEVTVQLNNSEFTIAINTLQSTIFGKQPESWQGQSLLSVLQKLNKTRKSPSKTNSFSLNP